MASDSTSPLGHPDPVARPRPSGVAISAPPLLADALRAAFEHQLPAVREWRAGDDPPAVLVLWAMRAATQLEWVEHVRASGCRGLVIIDTQQPRHTPPWLTGERLRYFSLGTTAEEVCDGVRAILRRIEARQARPAGQRLASDRPQHAQRLTQRERDVLEQLVLGATNPQIAERLDIGVESVKSHVSSILRKTGQARRQGAVVVCRELGLLSRRDAS
jgi:DNA-binding NarL/FixJ family response regulator